MPDLRGAEALLNMARKDLMALRGMLSEATFSDEIFGFHAQQAVEKGLKCWLSILVSDFPRTHDLQLLFSLLIEANADITPEMKLLEDLTDFAVIFRYGEVDLGESMDRPNVISQVADLIDYVGEVLNLYKRQ